jgi:hypothetical protein
MSSLAERLARPEVLALEPFDIAAQANRDFGPDAIKLDANENPYGPSEACVADIARSVAEVAALLKIPADKFIKTLVYKTDRGELVDQDLGVHHAKFLAPEGFEIRQRLVRGQALAAVRPDGEREDATAGKASQQRLAERTLAQLLRHRAVGRLPRPVLLLAAVPQRAFLQPDGLPPRPPRPGALSRRVGSSR